MWLALSVLPGILFVPSTPASRCLYQSRHRRRWSPAVTACCRRPPSIRKLRAHLFFFSKPLSCTSRMACHPEFEFYLGDKYPGVVAAANGVQESFLYLKKRKNTCVLSVGKTHASYRPEYTLPKKLQVKSRYSDLKGFTVELPDNQAITAELCSIGSAMAPYYYAIRSVSPLWTTLVEGYRGKGGAKVKVNRESGSFEMAVNLGAHDGHGTSLMPCMSSLLKYPLTQQRSALRIARLLLVRGSLSL